jgi:hypothetical protein
MKKKIEHHCDDDDDVCVARQFLHEKNYETTAQQ